MSADDILTQPPPPFDRRVTYGRDPNQSIDVRLPRSAGPRSTGRHPILLNIHGGFWRAKYDLAHAGHLCEAIRGRDIATFNIEYRRVGNIGGGWPGTFEDIRSAYLWVRKEAKRLGLDERRFVVMGHSAGGQLALCLAAHQPSLERVISLAGVVDLKRAYALHLSTDAVAEFMGGKPDAVAAHYREADPMELSIPRARQWLLHGKEDDVVPPDFGRDYAAHKKNVEKAGGKKERIELVEIAHAGHFDLIDPKAEAFKHVVAAVSAALG